VTTGPDEKAALLKRYSDRLAQHGPTIAALGWTKPKHTLRYRILLEYWLARPPSQPMRVLDFGCGFGDLFGYARDHGMAIDYTGLDINSDLIRVARERYPAARFLCMDLFEGDLDEKFDIVLSSGVHNYRLSDNQGYVERSFALFDRLSTLGFAANFLSNRVNFRSEQNHYSAPEDILSLALRYTSRVTLRHDYMPFEFTIFVDKRNEMHDKLTVFLPFVEDCADRHELD
jgi:SAM-dependent methyltransferase